MKRLRSALLGRPHTVVVNVPYRREDPSFERPFAESRRRPPPPTALRAVRAAAD